MRREMINLDKLDRSELSQDMGQIQRVAAAIGSDPEAIDWDDQPAIIVDTNGKILDGHHRVAACRVAGLSRWPAIVVDRREWDLRVEADGYKSACRWACDEADDHVTWGAI